MNHDGNQPRICWCGEECREAFRFQHDGLDLTWVVCPVCDVGALHPQPDEATLARAYSQSYYGSDRNKFIGPVAGLVSLFQQGRSKQAVKWVEKGSRFLDIGCGNGGFLLQLADKGFKAEGTELSRESASRVPMDSGIPIHVGDLLDLNLEEESYGGISLWHVFEHLRKPEEALRKIRKLIRPTGTLFLSMPNQESRQANRFGPDWFHLDPPRHLFGFGPKSLEILLLRTGFEVVKVHTWSLEQNPYGWIQSILNQWGFPRDQAYSTLKGLPRTTSGKLVDYGLLGMLTLPGLMGSTLESFVGRGATMTLIAKPSASGRG